jgi:hypothetical protein
MKISETMMDVELKRLKPNGTRQAVKPANASGPNIVF